MSREKKYRKQVLLLGSIIALIVIFVVDVTYEQEDSWLHEWSKVEDIEKFKVSNTFFVVSSLIKVGYNLCSVAIIGLLISNRISQYHLEDIDSRLNHFLDKTKNQFASTKIAIFKAVFGLRVEEEIIEILEHELFKKPVVRKDTVISIKFKENEINGDIFITEKMNWSYAVFNKLDSEYTYNIKVSTTDFEDRVILDEMQLTQANGTKQIVNPNKILDSPDGISRHAISCQIPPNESIRISNQYSLNFGIKGDYYQNTIGISEFHTGSLKIHIDKPKGYDFTIELYSNEHSLEMVPELKSKIDQEILVFQYEKPIFPGTGIEYNLRKIR